MTANHLLSASLFSELFHHNLVSADGRVTGSDKQLKDYSTFLIKQTKDKVASLHVERKNMVSDAEELLRMDSRTAEEDKLLKDLLHELGLKYDEDGLLAMKESKIPKERYLGPKEPKKSIFERKIEAGLERAKVLKRDLKNLDEWLEQISQFNCTTERQTVNWREAEKKYRQRTANRICDMENARMKLVKNFYKDYDDRLEKILNRKLPKRKYLSRKSVSQDAKDSKTDSPRRNVSKNGAVDEQSDTQRDGVAKDANAGDEGDDRTIPRDKTDDENETEESQSDSLNQRYAIGNSTETERTDHAENKDVINVENAGHACMRDDVAEDEWDARTFPKDNKDGEDETDESQSDAPNQSDAVENNSETKVTGHVKEE